MKSRAPNDPTVHVARYQLRLVAPSGNHPDAVRKRKLIQELKFQEEAGTHLEWVMQALLDKANADEVDAVAAEQSIADAAVARALAARKETISQAVHAAPPSEGEKVTPQSSTQPLSDAGQGVSADEESQSNQEGWKSDLYKDPVVTTQPVKAAPLPAGLSSVM